MAAGVKGAVPVPGPEAGQEAVVAALAQNISGMIAADRKVTALKQLQVSACSSGSPSICCSLSCHYVFPG